jgi:hypothetical protein
VPAPLRLIQSSAMHSSLRHIFRQLRAVALLGHVWLAISGSGCSNEAVPAERIMVKNDSRDAEYNVIAVVAGSQHFTLKPGQHFVLPKNTRFFSVQRAYRDYTRYYSVDCPPPGKSGTFIKLVDIHMRQIAGGCRTVDIYQK